MKGLTFFRRGLLCNMADSLWCKGDGKCLREESEDSDDDFMCQDCDLGCQRVKCANHWLCQQEKPQWKLDRGLCLTCHILFRASGGRGILLRKLEECPICLQLEECVSQPRCGHWVCKECFRKCYYPSMFHSQPELPLEIREEYEANPRDSKWETNELYLAFEEEEDAYQWDMHQRYLQLGKCPLCRQ